MSNLDALAQRAFLAEAGRYHEETRQSLELVIQHATTVLQSLNRDVNTAALRNVGQYAAEAVAAGNALNALNWAASLITEES